MLLHHPHQSFWLAYPVIDALTADAKTVVKVERITLLYYASRNIQIELSK